MNAPVCAIVSHPVSLCVCVHCVVFACESVRVADDESCALKSIRHSCWADKSSQNRDKYKVDTSGRSACSLVLKM